MINSGSSNDEQDYASQIQQSTSVSEYEADGAVFRSVDILPSPQYIGAPPSLHTGLEPLSFAGFSLPTVNVRPESKQKSSSKAGAVVRDSHNLVACSQWQFTGGFEGLPEVPMCYPLERTHVTISLEAMAPEELTGCVSYLCQKLSLAAHYESACKAFLTASDGTLISIQLFQDVDDFDGTRSTIFEVQRRSGKAETFFFHANKLLQVAKGVDHIMSMSMTDGRPKVKVPPIMIPEALKHVCMLDEAEERANVASELNMAVDLLRKDRLDANELGLELLCMITDETKSTINVCCIASKIIVTGVSDDGQTFDFGQLMKCVLAPSCRSMNYEDDLIETYTDGLKMRSLRVLSNAFKHFAEFGMTCVSNNGVFMHTSQLVSELLKLVRTAEHRPHEAVLATQCLEGLMVVSPEAKELALSMNVMQAVQEAESIGQCSHAILASESERVFTRLSNAGYITA